MGRYANTPAGVRVSAQAWSLHRHREVWKILKNGVPIDGSIKMASCQTPSRSMSCIIGFRRSAPAHVCVLRIGRHFAMLFKSCFIDLLKGRHEIQYRDALTDILQE
jgi:hypothetical protein